jgi:transmembrane sensor
VVHAGPRTITVLGTKFSVRRDGDRVEVAVIEGRVRVEDSGQSQPVSPTIVTRGDIVVAEGESTLVAVKSVERVTEELSWRTGRLTFDQATLGEAVAEFNRYNHKQLVIVDPEVAALRIGGSFEAENIQAFTRLLQRGFSLKIEEDGDVVKISS